MRNNSIVLTTLFIAILFSALFIGLMALSARSVSAESGSIAASGLSYQGETATLSEQVNSLAMSSSQNPPNSIAAPDQGADLRITNISAPIDEVLIGEQFTYTILVDNLGPDTAYNIVITDTLVTSAFVDANGCSLAVRTEGGLPDEFNCNFALSTGVFDLATMGSNHLHPRSPDDMGRIIITINATAERGVELTNVATVTSDTFDPDTSNNMAVDDLTVIELADLQLFKFSSPTNEVQAGEQFTYTIIVDNWGPTLARNVVITDTLVTSGFVDANGCSIAVRTDGGTVDEFDCNFAASIGVFDLGTFGSNHLNPRRPNDMGRIIITINATADSATDMTNLTTVTSASPDPDYSNNSAVDTLSVLDTTDLSVVKSMDPTTVTPGLPITYTLVVHNDGPSRAENVVAFDHLPPGVTLTGTSLEGSTGACIGQAQVQCSLGNLPAGDAVTITLNVLAHPDLKAGSFLQNDASVISDAYDKKMGNNFDSEIAAISVIADLEVTKSANSTTVHPGNQIEFSILVTNYGPSDIFGAQVVDEMPVGLTDVTWTCQSYSGSCSASGSGDINEFVDIPAGEDLQYTVYATVNSALAITNNVEVIPPDNAMDPDPSNNVDSITNEPFIFVINMPFVSGGPDRVFAPDLIVISTNITQYDIEFTIKNVGLQSVTDPFWVDLYVNPAPPPSAPNQVWNTLSLEGLVWGVVDPGLPLNPGDTLTLQTGDIFYYTPLSQINWPLSMSDEIYIQVDSFAESSVNGNILEDHEITKREYNNVFGPVNPSEGFSSSAPLIQEISPDLFSELPTR